MEIFVDHEMLRLWIVLLTNAVQDMYYGLWMMVLINIKAVVSSLDFCHENVWGSQGSAECLSTLVLEGAAQIMTALHGVLSNIIVLCCLEGCPKPWSPLQSMTWILLVLLCLFCFYVLLLTFSFYCASQLGYLQLSRCFLLFTILYRWFKLQP